ncbi:MAG TPA: sodium:solute symporter, partial [Candidatus Dormibacteraeota bacterium]|nr:sodium:solute symporter [Candidatus Dormibacteraeota bacterium]
FLVLAATLLGFAASKWSSGDLGGLNEWALGGRRFGTLLSWFLLGGDLYTAYTFIALPAIVYGVGALGFFAVPYATIAYPILFLLFARFWTIAHKSGYMTAGDFVRGCYRSRALEIAIAATGVLAALPYIALQIVGMRAVLTQLGGIFAIGGGAMPLAISFALLAAFTYVGGLRAPATIAVFKDALIYLTIAVAVVIIPPALGGWHAIFSAAQHALATPLNPQPLLIAPQLQFAYATLALGSAFSLFLYPHAITSLLSAKSADVVRRNAALLPLYSILLGIIALFGFAALAAGIHAPPNEIVPILFARFFPPWFAGLADATIVIGALVPASIMALGAANLFARNVIAPLLSRTPSENASATKLLTLAFCALSLLLVLSVNVRFAIYFQLLGGAWVLQTAPSIFLGLGKRSLPPQALFIGWAAGMIAATGFAVADGFTPNIALHFGSFTLIGFVAIYAVAINLLLSALTAPIFTARRQGARS